MKIGVTDSLLRLQKLILRGYSSWPPMMPEENLQAGLFGLNETREELLKRRESWDKEQWRKYAHFLEEQGASLDLKLFRTEMELLDANRKLSRKKQTSDNHHNYGKGLLGQPLPTKRSRGRPKKIRLTPKNRGRGRPKSTNWAQIQEVYQIKEEMQCKKRRYKDEEAVGEWFHRQGLGRWKASGSPQGRSMITKLREFRSLLKK